VKAKVYENYINQHDIIWSLKEQNKKLEYIKKTNNEKLQKKEEEIQS
jgi:hypothetical protein